MKAQLATLHAGLLACLLAYLLASLLACLSCVVLLCLLDLLYFAYFALLTALLCFGWLGFGLLALLCFATPSGIVWLVSNVQLTCLGLA